MSYAKPRAPGRGIRRALGGLCAALLAGGLVAGPASGSAAAALDTDKPPPEQTMPTEPVPGGFRSWPELLAAQEQLNAAADQLSAVAEREPGFTGIEAAPELGRLRLFWHGHPPEPVIEQVDQLRREVPVDVLPAEHPLAELNSTQAAIAAEPGVNVVAPHVDGSGLTVGYQGSEQDARALPAIRDATVPVTVEPSDQTRPAGCTGRLDDCSPYWGGAGYAPPGGGACSTGFTLKFTSFLSPGPRTWYRMLSAGHCGADGDAFTDGGGEALGTVTGDSDTADLLLISPTPSGSFGSRVYTGGQTGFTNQPVVAAKASHVGNWVCTSGLGGQKCAIKVSHVNVTLWGTVKTVRAATTLPAFAGSAACVFDSGGPVIVHRRAGGVNAMGTISAISQFNPLIVGCAMVVHYVDILTALAHYQPGFGSVAVRTG